MPKPRLRSRDVIAERTYSTADQDFTVTVRIGRPRRVAGSTTYHCIAELREPGRIWTWPLVGLDSFEAIQLALVMLGTNLQHIQELLDGRLVCDRSACETLGFPTYPHFSLKSAIQRSDQLTGQ
jgi:hypothetical protein